MRLLGLEYLCAETLAGLSEEATLRKAALFAKSLDIGQMVALTGDLGAGKTTFVRGIGAALGITQGIHSPSYALVQTYAGPIPINHIDLYRLSPAMDQASGMAELGLEELAATPGLTFIEWPERLPPGWRFDAWVHMEVEEDDTRRLFFYRPVGAGMQGEQAS